MSERITCCVPFCKRTSKNEKGWIEWICQKHWSATSRVWRRRRSLFKRRGRPDFANRMWDRLKAQAIGRALGL